MLCCRDGRAAINAAARLRGEGGKRHQTAVYQQVSDSVPTDHVLRLPESGTLVHRGGGGGSDVTGDKLAPLGDQFGTHRLCWRKLETASLRIMTGVCGPRKSSAARRLGSDRRHRRAPLATAAARPPPPPPPTADGTRQAVARRCRAMDHKILLTRQKQTTTR